MGNLLKALIAMILKKLVEKWLFPKLKEMADASENKIDDVLTSPEAIDNATKVINLGIDKIKEKI